MRSRVRILRRHGFDAGDSVGGPAAVDPDALKAKAAKNKFRPTGEKRLEFLRQMRVVGPEGKASATHRRAGEAAAFNREALHRAAFDDEAA